MWIETNKRRHKRQTRSKHFGEGKCHCSNFTSRGHICTNNQVEDPDAPKYSLGIPKEGPREHRLNILSLPPGSFRHSMTGHQNFGIEGRMVAMMKSPFAICSFFLLIASLGWEELEKEDKR